MRWIGGRESSNVDDRRGLSAGGGVAVGGGIIGVIFLVIKLLPGGEVSGDIQQQVQNQPQEMTAEEKAKDDERAKFVRVVLGYTEDVWDSLFAVKGKQYLKPTLAFSGIAWSQHAEWPVQHRVRFIAPVTRKSTLIFHFTRN